MTAKSCLLSLLGTLILSLTAPAAEIRGVILKVDAEKNIVTIEGRGPGVRGVMMTFQLDKDTQVHIGRKPAQVADLSPGRRVRVAYEVHGGQRVALLITLLGGQPAVRPPVMPAQPSDGTGVSGILRRVAATDREIVIISPGSKGGGEIETTVLVPDDAKITKDQKAISFDDLKEGDQVLVQPEKRDGKLVAKSIQLGAKAANADPRANPGPTRIERLRQALKMLDMLLQMADQKSK